ncbi:LysR substrate-binding domain-containing protein [Dickeya undicola]|uniref:LysR substrate-binding domain-containing protein n=1 Tax=Dickeya undicola TaxID=1577887 RepID=UPI003F28BD70
MPSPGVEKITYREDQLVVLVSPHHPLAEYQDVTFADTLPFDFVGLNNGSSLLKLLQDTAEEHGKMLRLRIQVSSFDGVCRMIEAGLGISILPEGAIRPEILGAGLRAIRLTDGWSTRKLWLGIKSGAILQPEAANLLAHLRQPV